MAGRKQEHLNEVVQHKLGTILQREASDPRFATVTISNVVLSKDRSHARVSVSSYAQDTDPADLIVCLNRAAGFFSRTLGRTMQTRNTPRISFHYDHGFDQAQEIEELLHSIKQEAAE